MNNKQAKIRLEGIRKALKNGNISYGELAELQGLVNYIDEGDVELQEAAGLPEYEIEISWHIDDVKSIAEDLTVKQCRQVLALAKSEHDASIGINWEVLKVWADHVREGKA